MRRSTSTRTYAILLCVLIHTAHALAVRAQTCTLTEMQKFAPTDVDDSDQFGGSVSASKDFAIFGAWGADTDGRALGAAYVFRRDDGGTPSNPADDIWIQHAKLTAENGMAGEFFGWSVSISGNRALVGARFHPVATQSGAAFVFRLDDNNTPSDPSDDLWTQEDRLIASDAARRDDFGLAVGISGRRAIIGAPQDDDACPEGFFPECNARGECPGSCRTCDDETNTCIIGVPQCCDSGSAYIFRHDDNGTPDNPGDDFWIEEAKLTASDASPGDMFGFSVAMGSDHAIVAAWFDDEGGENAGAAYIFRRDDNGTPTDDRDDTWIEQQKLIASDAAIFDNFGFSVAIDRSRVVVGSWLDDDAGSLSGSAYVFRRDDNGTRTFPDDDFWVEEAKLTASDGAAGDEFGKSVSIDGDLIAVGAYEDDDACSEEEVFFAECATNDDCPGSCGPCVTDTLTCFAAIPGCCDSGSAYVFRRDDGATPLDPTDDSWFEVAKVTASDTAAGDFFGRVGLGGGFLVAGSLDAAAGHRVGAAYAFYVGGECTTVADFARFQACFSDSGGGVIPGCAESDLDQDGDVDHTDLSHFLLTFTGP